MAGKPKKSIPALDLNRFSGRLRSETDRACAVLGGAMVDARLESLFIRRLSGHQSDLLNGLGPLSTFSARSKVAHALSWIDDDLFNDLEVIRRIRNDFAHNFDHELSFSTITISDRCRLLRSAEAYIEGTESVLRDNSQSVKFSAGLVDSFIEKMRPPRIRFELAIGFISQFLDEIPGTRGAYAYLNLLSTLRDLAQSTRPSIYSRTASDSDRPTPDGLVKEK